MKLFRILLPLLMIFSFCTSVNAQKGKCKFDVEKKDAFSGVEYKSVKVDIMATYEKANNRYSLEFIKNDTLFTLTITRNFVGKLVDVIPQGHEILFKQAGGAIMHLLVSDETIPTLNSTGTSVTSTYKISIKLSKDDLKKLSGKPITNLKFAIGKLDVQGEFSNEEAEKITQICKCLLQ